MRNKLAEGFYSIKDAASLIALDVVGMNAGKLRKFFRETRRYEATIRSERAYKDGRVTDISFFDLMELRAIAHFRNRGSSAQALRLAATEARSTFGEYPFSRKDVIFYKQGKDIIAEAALETKDKALYNLVTKQFEFELVKEFFDKGVKWDANEQFPISWHPKNVEFPEIVIDPRVSFGRPTVADYGIETETLYSAWVASEGDYDEVADWFELPSEKVRRAIKFQSELPN